MDVIAEMQFSANNIYNMNNLLIKSENIKALNYLLSEKKLKGKIDLVYIDPPFATGGSFTISNGPNSTISNSNNRQLAYADKLMGEDFLNFIKQRLKIYKRSSCCFYLNETKKEELK